MTKLCSGQGNLDAATADDYDDDTAYAATADENNPYMSPSQATEKLHLNIIVDLHGLLHTIRIKRCTLDTSFTDLFVFTYPKFNANYVV